ncbi:MAG: IS66 family transposase [Pseudohongiellaceae bacterium]
MAIDFAETQLYIRHFQSKGCDPEIVANTEGIFNLCLYYAGELAQLTSALEKNTLTITRLKAIVFGRATADDEAAKADSAPPDADATPSTADNTAGDPATLPSVAEQQADDAQSKTDAQPKKKTPGHGRLGADAYTGAETVACSCQYRAGDRCPQCQQGRLRLIDPKVKIHIDGRPPLLATRFELEQLTCSFCPWTTTASAPVDLTAKYSPQAKATLAYLHYGMGLPYYRLAKMQRMLGVPIPVSTQSDLMASMMGPVHAVFNYLMVYAAQSPLIFQDDTGVKIQALCQENKRLNPPRRGMYTSGFIAEGEHTVVLYFSGRAHAGENFERLMAAREPHLAPVIRMADALAANNALSTPIIVAKCNAHAFRRFRDLIAAYPEAALSVLSTYGQIYAYDQHCKEAGLDDQARLVYHQTHSEPLMTAMKTEVDKQWQTAEPNSVLAGECQYLINHWEGLTAFLRVAGAPLDNNALEAMLKFMITYRKNSQTFRTAYSADYGSRLISVIVTCMINGVNAIDYLTQLQRHEKSVWQNPAAWTPWQYQATLNRANARQAA